MRYRFDCFEGMFNPKNVAVVGVSTEGWGFGKGILLSLKSIGFEGNVYPVNPKGGTIAGLDICRSIEDIPGTIDFAIIAVPGSRVPEALEKCRLKGAVGAEILSSGFKELGTAEGHALEVEIQKIAERGIRVIGPNCFGIYCPKSGLTFLPGPDLARVPGDLSFAAQSGGMSIDFASVGKWMGLKFAKMVSFGNGADLRETELLAYFKTDPETRIIAMYIEGIEDGDAFYKALQATTPTKPVIIVKGGLSESGSRAVASHTASMGGSRIIWQSVLIQAGANQVKDMKETALASLGFSMLPWRAYKGLCVVGGGGALGVAACDAAEAHGFHLPAFKPALSEKIMALLPQPGSSAANPIDVANPFMSPAQLKNALMAAAEDDGIDIQVLIQLFDHYKVRAGGMNVSVLEDFVPYMALADSIKEVMEKTGKPVVLVMPNHRLSLDDMDIETVMRKARKAFLDRGIPVYDHLRDALFSISQVSRYAEFIHRPVCAGKGREPVAFFSGSTPNAMREMIDKMLCEGRQTLSEYESKRFLSGFGIPVTREILAETVEEAIAAARSIGYPVAVKGCSPFIVHKTESQLIRLNVKDDTELASVCTSLLAKLEDQGALIIQEMVKGSRELVVGMNRDHQFGPCVMFGLGGIYTEILNDVVFRKAPLSRKDALDMIHDIRGKRLLESTRGFPAVDQEALIQILMTIGDIALSENRIREIDINPIIIRGNKPVAVDALIVLNN